MQIDYRYINSNKLPREILIIESLLKGFKGPLRKILESELEHGNLIFDVIEDFPTSGSLQVSMQEPFYKSYSIEGVEKAQCSDPHYSNVEYHFGEPLNILVGPLGDR